MESWLVDPENQEVPIHALGRSSSFRAWEGIQAFGVVAQVRLLAD